MKKAMPTWQMVGFISTGILGTLLHFLFDWTHGNALVGVFSAVNESIWEHTKLLFYPMVLFAIVECKVWGREVACFWCIKLMGVFAGIVLIPVLYYTYTGVLGVSADWFNITIFFIVAAAVYYLETKLFQMNQCCKIEPWLCAVGLGAIAVCYTALTFWPPHVPLFQDPISGTYGFFGVG